MDAVNNFKFSALCPPNEEQWKRICEFASQQPNAQHHFHWKHYFLMSKLPYSHAIVCTTNESDEYIGMVIFNQPDTISISYVGNFLVAEQHRGKGIGSQIWSLMLEHTDSSRVVVLNAFEPMATKYRAADMPVPGPTFQIINGNTEQLQNALEHKMGDEKELQASFHIKDIDSKEIIESVLVYDRKLAHFDRSPFMEVFFPLSDHKKAICDSDGTVVAFAAAFPLLHEKDYKIGPFYAENFNLALFALCTLIQDISAPNFSITVPYGTDNGQKLIEFLVKEAQCTIGKQLHRCYSREFDCPIDWNRVFSMAGHIASPLAV